MYRVLIVIFLASCLASCSSPDPLGPNEYRLGERTVTVRPPPSFNRLADSDPMVIARAKFIASSGGKLLAEFHDAESARARDTNAAGVRVVRWALLSSNIKLESTKISDPGFEEVRTTYREKTSPLYEGGGDATSMLNDFYESTNDASDSELKVEQFANVGPFGIFVDEDDYIGELSISTQKVERDGELAEVLVTSTTMVIHVKEKLLFSGIYCTCRSVEDVEWLITTSLEWAEAIRADN